MDPENVTAKFAVRIALPIPEIGLIAIAVLRCEPQSWRRGSRRGWGMVPFEERWWVPMGPP